MKKFGVLFVLLITGLNSFGINPEAKRLLPYIVEINEFDSTVKRGTSQLRIVCVDGYTTSKPAEGVYLKFNKSKKRYRTDSLGRVDIILKPGEFTVETESRLYRSAAITNFHLNDQHYVEITLFLFKEKTATRKPAIYLYSDSILDMNLKVIPNGKFTFTYPQHNDGWSVRVLPNGDLSVNDKPYQYLFWEGERDIWDIGNTGFVVNSDTVVQFLENKLRYIGFNDREINDFIVYWGPVLIANKLNQINFIVGENYAKTIGQIESSVPIDVSIRLFMSYVPLKKEIDLEPQTLPEYKRYGTVLVEWGGGEVVNLNLANY